MATTTTLTKSTKSASTSVVRHRRSSITSAGLAGGGSMGGSAVVMDYVASRAWQLGALDAQGSPEAAAQAAAATQTTTAVGFFALFTFSTVKERWLMAAGLLSAGVAGLAMPVWLLLLAQSLQTFNDIGKIVKQGGDISILYDQMNALIYSFAIVGAVSLFSGAFYVAIFTYTGERQTLRIREKFVQSAFRQEAAWFDARGGDPQELPTLAANALQRIGEAIGRPVADTFANLLSALGCLAVALGLDPPLALFMVCVLPIIGIVISIVFCFMRSRSARALENFAAAGAFATEVISGIKTVASLCAELWAKKKYEGMARQAQFHSIYAGILSKLASGLMGLLFYGTYSMAFIFGTEQVAQTKGVEQSHFNPFYCMFQDCGITGSEVMVCIYGIILCAQFFALMAPGIQAVNLGRTAASDIFGTIHRTPAIDISSSEGKVLGDDYDGNLELRNLFFAYPSRPNDYIFQGFNLSIAAGSSVALVGPSGSGKSTISKLLLRLYDPLGGAVLADGIPLRDLNLASWRSQIGYVPQEPTLFPGTIRENIARGLLSAGASGADAAEATMEQVIEAAKAASAHDFISELPDGYETFYSGASLQLSGGQTQRIAIARAIIRNPKVLVLDEATSALDTQSEKVVQNALESIRQSRKLTTISVAHRLTTIISCDQIAVIAEGSIQELGTHQELFEEGGIYAQLCEAQGITADSKDAVEAKDGGGVVEATTTTAAEPTKDEQPNGDPDDVEAGVVAKKGEKKEEPEEEEMAPMERLWQYNKPEACYMAFGSIGAILVGALPPTEGILFGMITANLLGESDIDKMKAENQTYSLFFLVLAGVCLLGNLALGCFAVSGLRLTRRMRVAVFERIMRQSMGWFDFPEHSTGELTTRLEEDSEAVANVTGYQLGQRIQIASSLIAGIAISLAFSWQIGLISLACMPFIVGAGLLQARCSRPPVFEQEGLSAPTILERGFHDVFVLQAYNLQDVVSDQYSKALKPDAEYKVKQGIYTGLVYGFTQFAVFSTFALLFYVGIELMVAQKTEFQDFFISLLAVMFAAFGVGQANADFSSRQRGLVAAARIFLVLDEPPDKDDPFSEEGTCPSALEGSVNFESVGFSYPTRPDAQVFYPSADRDGFNLSIPAKQSVAFTGRSGCGKSTALQLVMRFYRATSGTVSMDKEDVSSLNMAWLRGNTGYVGQMPVLFQGSVRDNVRLGKPEASEEEIVKACRAANAHEFVTSLSDQYDTDIGAGGSLLSGGQKQRIAIARAIIKDPKILVLDEATSALDSESEKIVQKTLDDMQQANPRTTLVVAHRLETVRNCDKIVVLDRGGVKEEGTHSDLLEQKGVYYGLWKKQGGSLDKKQD